MNAIKLLIEDHKQVELMFKEIEKANHAGKQKVFLKVKAALEAHAYIEETIFYPTLQSEGDKGLIEITSEAVKEHMDMKCFLGELAAAAADRSKFDPLIIKLVEDVRHHVKEEEGEMFPTVEKFLPREVLDDLGSRMASEKERFQSSTETLYG